MKFSNACLLEKFDSILACNALNQEIPTGQRMIIFTSFTTTVIKKGLYEIILESQLITQSVKSFTEKLTYICLVQLPCLVINLRITFFSPFQGALFRKFVFRWGGWVVKLVRVMLVMRHTYVVSEKIPVSTRTL